MHRKVATFFSFRLYFVIQHNGNYKKQTNGNHVNIGEFPNNNQNTSRHNIFFIITEEVEQFWAI